VNVKVTALPTVYGPMPPRGAVIVGGEMSVAAAADVVEAHAAPTITAGASMRVQRSMVFSPEGGGPQQADPYPSTRGSYGVRETFGRERLTNARPRQN
jgi:hypothetical protein